MRKHQRIRLVYWLTHPRLWPVALALAAVLCIANQSCGDTLTNAAGAGPGVPSGQSAVSAPSAAQMSDDEIRELFANIRNDNRQVRMAIIERIRKAGHGVHLETCMLFHLTGSERSTHWEAVRMLADMGYAGTGTFTNDPLGIVTNAFDIFLGLVETPGPLPSSDAARLLGNYRSPRQVQPSIPALARALTSGWSVVQFEAAAALAKFGTPEADAALLAAKKDSHSTEFRHAVNVLLAGNGNTNAVARLVDSRGAG